MIASNAYICELYQQLEGIDEPVELRKKRQEVHAQVLRATSFLPSKLAQKYKYYDNHSDLVQTGKLCLYMAIRSFNPEKSRNFYGWCFKWIRKEIARAALDQKKYYETFELTTDPAQDSIDLLTPEDTVFVKEKDILLSNIIENLGEQKQYIITHVFGIDARPSSLRQIGKAISMSHEQVRRLKTAAIQELGQDERMAIFRE